MSGSQKPWTAYDDALLREMMRFLNTVLAIRAKRPAIAAALGRTQISVSSRAVRLGLRLGCPAKPSINIPGNL